MADEQRVAVVTGGSGAIGNAIVTALEESEHRTVALGRRTEIACDLTPESSAKEAAAAVLERHGRRDALVHCAAVFDAMPLSELDLPRRRRLMAGNVEASLWLAQAFAPGMAERGFGRIVLISPDAQWTPQAQ
ncbi:SDR family NAD(P)-dependent oxidoreductase [Streptomyces tendae]|uniref:SDR family NAD(P)-dependent oxidoreductase n=1 Tax=Streptomyces tendae TaxID=1932 RepID=UPI00379F6287